MKKHPIIDALKPSVMNFDLARMRKVMSMLGNPQNSFPSVHVAGTNGKGSVCAMLSNALIHSGLRVGLTTSPHLENINERFQINGRAISDVDLDRLARRLIKLFPHLTQFEFLTTLAFVWFSENKLDVAVVETGLGGRLDATNVMTRVLTSVITNIDFDHMNWLGNTLEKIAAEKAGIIKPGIPVLSGVTGSAGRVIESVAKKRHSPFTHVSDSLYHGRLSMEGRHQQKNATLALAVLRILKSRLAGVKESSIAKGISTAVWPGRFERFLIGSARNRRIVILDGAHNPAGCKVLVQTLREKKLAPVNFLFGALKDKKIDAMIRTLGPVATCCVTTGVPSDRSADANDLAANSIWRKKSMAAGSLDEAWEMVAKNANNRPVVVAGSLYLVGEIRRKLK